MDKEVGYRNLIVIKNIFKLSLSLISMFFLFVVISTSVDAHPGRTASDGCHYCRTNCSSWGVGWNSRHCHSGYSAPSYSPPSSSYGSCPANSTYSSSEDSCICHANYTPSSNKTSCVALPANAYAVESKTDAWLCNEGYREEGNTCVKKESCEIDGQEVLITRIVDGDTVEFVCDGKKEKIRIIGIDTPETVHPSKPVEYFGKEASKKIEELVLNKKVILKKSQDSDNRGTYGRLLRYLEINDEDIGATMIKDGYAFSYKKYPHERLEKYNRLEIDARENKVGLWAFEDEDIVISGLEDKPETESKSTNYNWLWWLGGVGVVVFWVYKWIVSRNSYY